jgi:hypothetical protein
MTEDQIERAARALCRMRGQAPDERVTQEVFNGLRGFVEGLQVRGCRWEFAAYEIRAVLQIQQAIKEATSEPTQDAEPAQGVVTAEEKLLRRDLQEAKELLEWAARFMRSMGAFGIAGDNRDELVERIRRFLDRKDT